MWLRRGENKNHWKNESQSTERQNIGMVIKMVWKSAKIKTGAVLERLTIRRSKILEERGRMTQGS